MLYCELFEIFVFCLCVHCGKIYSLFGTTSLSEIISENEVVLTVLFNNYICKHLVYE